jgi:hypothetical protein
MQAYDTTIKEKYDKIKYELFDAFLDMVWNNICILHKTDTKHCIIDLEEYFHSHISGVMKRYIFGDNRELKQIFFSELFIMLRQEYPHCKIQYNRLLGDNRIITVDWS